MLTVKETLNLMTWFRRVPKSKKEEIKLRKFVKDIIARRK